MAQAVDKVNVVVKDSKWYYDDAGVRTEGDGATADDVSPREAANLAKAGALEPGSDVLMDESDFTEFIASLDVKNRG